MNSKSNRFFLFLAAFLFCCQVFASSGNTTMVYTEEITLDASREIVWAAITDPEIVSSYYLAPLVKLEAKTGGMIIYGTAEMPLISGKIIQFIPGELLQHSFQFDETTHSGVIEDSASRVTYELLANGNKTTLRLVHDQFGNDRQTYENVKFGWPIILQGLQKRLQTN